MAADAPAGRPAFACGRPEKPAGDPFERVPVGFPGPDASPRAVPVAGATSGGASEGLITPPDVNRVGIPALDRETSPGGQGTSPGSARALRRTSPRGKSTPEPRGVADGPSPPRVKRQFGESVLSREARKYIRSFFKKGGMFFDLSRYYDKKLYSRFYKWVYMMKLNNSLLNRFFYI